MLTENTASEIKSTRSLGQMVYSEESKFKLDKWVVY